MHQSQRFQLAQDLTSGRVKIQDLSEAEQIAAFGSVFYRSDLFKGEAEGHPFRGNQYTSGQVVSHKGRKAKVVAGDEMDPESTRSWIQYEDNPDEDAIVNNAELTLAEKAELESYSYEELQREKRLADFERDEERSLALAGEMDRRNRAEHEGSVNPLSNDEEDIKARELQAYEEKTKRAKEWNSKYDQQVGQEHADVFRQQFAEDPQAAQEWVDSLESEDYRRMKTALGDEFEFDPRGNIQAKGPKIPDYTGQAMGMSEAEFNHLESKGMMKPWGPSKEGQAELKRLREGKTRGYSAAGQQRQDRRAKIESQNPGKTVEQVLGDKVKAQQNHISATTVELANSEMTQMALEHLQDNNFKVTRRGSKLYFDNPKDQNAAIESLRGLGIKSGLDSQRALLPKAQRMDTAEEIRAATAADRRAQRGPNWKTKLKADAERASRR